MLVLSRKVGERIVIDGGITVTVLESTGSRVRLGFDAPRDVFIRRSEIDFDTTPLAKVPVTEPQPGHVGRRQYVLKN